MTKISVLATFSVLVFASVLMAKVATNPLVSLAPRENAPSRSSVSTKAVAEDPFLKKKMKRNNRILLAQNSNLQQMVSLSPYTRMKNTTKVAINENTLTNSISTNLKESADSQSSSEKTFGITAQLGYTQALYDKQDGSREKSYDYLFSPSAKVSDNYSVAGIFTASTDANNRDGSDFGRAKLLLAHKSIEVASSTNILKSWTFSPAFGFNLPASKSARDDQSLLVGLSPELTFGPNSSALGSERWSLIFNLKVSRNFHTYEISKSGNSNSQYGSSQAATVGYLLQRNFSLELNLMHYNAWTYEGKATEAYGHSQEIAYRVNNNLILALGHQFGSSGVSIYGPDGQTLNLGIANEKYSYAYSSLTLIY